MLYRLVICTVLTWLSWPGILCGKDTKPAKPDPSILTVERIYAEQEFSAQDYSGQWIDAQNAYFRLEKSSRGGQDLVRYDVAADEKAKVVVVESAAFIPPNESKPLTIESFAWSENQAKLLIYTNSKRVWRQKTRGDYWVLDVTSRELRQLGGDAPPSSLMFAKFSPDGNSVAYVRDRNIHVESLLDGAIAQITTTPTEEIINGTFDWVYEEELRLRDGFRWSPDGAWIAYWQIDTSGVAKFSLINNTDTFYPTTKVFAYPKTGQRNPACRIGMAHVASEKTRWLELPGDDRDHYVAHVEWIPGTDQLLIQQLNRLQNANRVMVASVRSPKAEVLFVEEDDAWVDVHDELFWIDDGARFTWISERDGWRHVYLVARHNGECLLATPGEFDVIRLVKVDQKKGFLYFLASPDNPTQQYLFRIRFDGSELEQVTPAKQQGTHGYDFSSDATFAFHTWSRFGKPPKTELVELPEHDVVKKLVNNKELRKRLRKLKLGKTEFFRVKVGDDVQGDDVEDDGVELDAWCIQPPEFDPAKKYPLLVYVYGEPAGQTVLDRWMGNGYLWHQMLAQQGYFVMSFDNRGTPAPRGRDWRKAVYRQVGILAPREQAAAIRRTLADRPYLDSRRVGVWGWSGGGSMSLNAIFKFPQLYRTAISIAPVPNQRYYDTIYQERYMGLPNDNVDGYTNGSPFHFAKQLEGNLLIIHGTGDDNCHYQTTEALINELVRHNKHFTMMAYPNRTHAIREGEGTTRHLRELMTRYLHENLPAGPRE